MKYTGTIVVAALSGSAADVTASRWKGLGYFRTRVIPANPNSPGEFGQAEHRSRFARCVSWWHDVEQQIQDECARLTFGLARSGFNHFTDRNLTDMSKGTASSRKDAVPPRIMPLNASVNPIGELTVVVGPTVAKSLSLSWLQGEALPGDTIYVLAGEAVDADTMPDNLFLQSKEVVAVGDFSFSPVMPVGNQGYRVFVLVEHGADSTFSIARSGWAVSKAA